jgi:hypothetical protein
MAAGLAALSSPIGIGCFGKLWLPWCTSISKRTERISGTVVFTKPLNAIPVKESKNKPGIQGNWIINKLSKLAAK